MQARDWLGVALDDAVPVQVARVLGAGRAEAPALVEADGLPPGLLAGAPPRHAPSRLHRPRRDARRAILVSHFASLPLVEDLVLGQPVRAAPVDLGHVADAVGHTDPDRPASVVRATLTSGALRVLVALVADAQSAVVATVADALLVRAALAARRAGLRAGVAHVAHAVLVRVGLVGVGRRRTVVAQIAEVVAVAVRRAALRRRRGGRRRRRDGRR